MCVMSQVADFGLLYLILIVFVMFDQGQADSYIKTSPATSTNTTYIGTAYINQFASQTFITAKFLGIPFAKPPVRFSKPELATPEDEVIQATRFGDMCQQTVLAGVDCMAGLTMSENCLFLNIFVPLPSLTAGDVRNSSVNETASSTTTTDTYEGQISNATSNTVMTSSSAPTPTQAPQTSVDDINEDKLLVLPSNGTKFAVMVYIHGGAFTQGSGNCYDGSHLAGLGNIIVVTFNYRLGPFGFLSTMDDVIPGNLGLWDQYTALLWVKKNIAHFGGDPDRITVAGQSSGGYSSILQSLFQSDGSLFQSNGSLFQRMIAQSGTPAVFKSVSTVGHDTTIQVAKSLNCSVTDTSREIKLCLMNQSAEALSRVPTPPIVPGITSIQPTLEGPFIKEDPFVLLSQMAVPAGTIKSSVPASFTSKDLLIGLAAEDGDVKVLLWAVAAAKGNTTLLIQLIQSLITPETFKDIIRQYFLKSYSDVVDEIVIDAVIDRYTDWQNPDNYSNLSYRVIEMITDIYNGIPTLDTASAHIRRQENTSKYNDTVTPSSTQPGQSTQTTVSAGGTSDQTQEPSVPDKGSIQNGYEVQGRTYVYRFSFPAANSLPSSIPWFKGTGHSSDLPYVFGWSSLTSETDVQLSKTMITYWSNFVKTGDPNQDEPVEGNTSSPAAGTTAGPTVGASRLPQWPEYDNQDEQYLEISPNPLPKSRMRASYRHFWSSYIPRLRLHLQDVYNAGVKSVPVGECPEGQTNGQDVMKMNICVGILTTGLIQVVLNLL